MLKIRLAKKFEIKWINKCYDEVEFVHSVFGNEIIAIAELDDQKAGLGRLVTIDKSTLELGGMYVFEAFRNQGIASKIVTFLLDHSVSTQTIYCIPFEHLAPLYKKYGFVPCPNIEQTPKELVEKYLWCKRKYPHPTSLLILETKKNIPRPPSSNLTIR